MGILVGHDNHRVWTQTCGGHLYRIVRYPRDRITGEHIRNRLADRRIRRIIDICDVNLGPLGVQHDIVRPHREALTLRVSRSVAIRLRIPARKCFSAADQITGIAQDCDALALFVFGAIQGDAAVVRTVAVAHAGI